MSAAAISYTTDAKACNSKKSDSCEESGSTLLRKVPIAAELWQEIEAAELHPVVKTLVYWIIYRCLTTRAARCVIHQSLLDVAYNSDRRKELIAFIKKSRYIRPASNGSYRAEKYAKSYELHNLDLQREEYQHNNEMMCDDGALSVVADSVVWRSVDFGCLLDVMRKGWERKGWNRSKLNAEWSLEAVDESTLTKEQILEKMADEPEKAEQHAAQHQRYCDKRTDGIFRKDGRGYSSATSLPRWIRDLVVRFSGSAESIDMRSFYPWALVAERRVYLVRSGLDTTQEDQLMDLIDRGEFYRTMAELADLPFETSEQQRTLKRDFQRFCLFGPIGWHTLWKALQKIAPGVCKDIRWWRSQPGGATRLAHFLQRAEGHLMTDGLIDWLVSGGIPAVQIHDGAILPKGVGEIAAEYLKQRSKEIYGRSCAVKIEVV